MKFTVLRSKFLDGLSTIQNVVASKSALQIVNNCMVQTVENSLILTTTDLDVSVKYILDEDVKIIEPGATTLPVKRLLSIVRELPEGEIIVEVGDDDIASVYCKSLSAMYKLIGLDVHGFPPLTELSEDSASYLVDQGVFREMLRKTAYAVLPEDESRRALTGVLLKFKDGKLTMVATDGRRLSIIDQEVEFSPENECEMVLPAKAFNELLRLLSLEGPMKIYHHASQIIFDCGKFVFFSKLIEVPYANYQSVIPKSSQEHITINRESFIQALRRVSLVSTVQSNSVRLVFDDNQLTVAMMSVEVGEASESIPVKYIGARMVSYYNVKFILDCLTSLDDDDIIFEISEGYAPSIIKCTLPFMCVIMPVRG